MNSQTYRIRLTRTLYTISCLLLIQLNSSAQGLTVSNAHLNFGNAYENAPDSLPLTIYNNLSHPVNVTGIRFYDTYGSPAFSVNTSGFNIPSSSSNIVWIKFSPLHNMDHNSELVIENDALRGYVSVDLTGHGKYSNTYYDLTENLAEEPLKNMLHTITGIGYDTLGYSNPTTARDSMFMWLDNQRVNGQGASQNTLEGVYTGILAVGYTSRTNCQTADTFNTEHTFPQSLFSSQEPMVSDLHHLFPTDDASNHYRSNKPFGMVPSPAWTSGGSKGNSSMFEPRDLQKGATARAMIYFVLRYQNYSNYFTSQENILRTWHHNFPPSLVEWKRNDDINLIQHNRNPFVDYPQFIDRIHSISAYSSAPSTPSIDLTQDTIQYGFVPQSASTIFHYVVVNNGNTPVHFSAFSMSNPGVLSFQSGGNDTTIAAGDALGIDIRLLVSNSNPVHEFLNFQTDVPASTIVSVPVLANDSLYSGIQETEENIFTIYPNPANQSIVINSRLHGNTQAELSNSLGSMLYKETFFSNGHSHTLDVSKLPRGIYFLKIENGNSSRFQKFIKL
ncbi:MAG: endonuclease [Bacteroidetes bacterium]|nr:endonuclease [Bacteroidota bacterium]